MPDNKYLPAYPHFAYETTDNGSPGCYTTQSGISQRTLIAAMCLQGYCANPEAWKEWTPGQMIEESLRQRQADNLLTHLQNT